MDFDDYLYEARKTAIYPRDRALEYLTLGLVSEAGEVAGKIKKWIRGDFADDVTMAEELGDVLWYLVMLADEIDYPLAVIAEENLLKLRDRRSVASSADRETTDD